MKIKEMLEADEKVLWEGRPEIGIFVLGRRIDRWVVYLFLIYSAIISLIIFFDEYNRSFMIFNFLIIPIFYGVFFWLLFNFYKFRTSYLITDKRVLSFVDLFLVRSNSQALIDRIQRLDKTVYPGSIIGRVSSDEVSLIDIKDYESAYKIIDNLISKRRRLD